jgi:hypothetical protein
MALTREDIEKMSVKRLRQLDISEPADEKLVQDLIQEKLSAQGIVGAPARAAAHATDNLTPETEAILQAQIDKQNAARKAARTAPILDHEAADQQREDEVAQKLAELEAEKAQLDAASQTPFVPEAPEPGPLPEPGAEAPVTEAPVTEAPVAEAPEVAPAPVTRTPRAPRGGNKKK